MKMLWITSVPAGAEPGSTLTNLRVVDAVCSVRDTAVHVILRNPSA